MTMLQIAVVASAVIALIGCYGGEITGSSDDRGVVGRVAIAAGMPNESPAGERVGVGMSGMSAVDADRSRAA